MDNIECEKELKAVCKSIVIGDKIALIQSLKRLKPYFGTYNDSMHNYTIHGVLNDLFGKNEPILVQSDKTPPPYYGEESENYRLQPEPVTMCGETYYLYSKPFGIYLLAERYEITFTDEEKQLIAYLSDYYDKRIALKPTGLEEQFDDAKDLSEFSATEFMEINGIVAPDEKNWRTMFDRLHGEGYISGASLAEFNEVINHHRKLNGNKIMWNGTLAAGLYFFKQLGLKTAEINRCVENRNGKPFNDHTISKALKPELDAILKLKP